MRNARTDTGYIQSPDSQGTMGSIEWIDHQTKMRYRKRYQEVKRDHNLEEKALTNTIRCKAFSAQVRPEICLLRKKRSTYHPCMKCKAPMKG